MLKRWTVNPLQNVEKINKRLDAVEELVAKRPLCKEIQKKFATLPDIERIMTRIYTYSVKTKTKAFWVDAQAVNRLDEFFELLQQLSDLVDMLIDIRKFHGKIKSVRLGQLTGLKKLVVAKDNEEMNSGDEEADAAMEDEEDINSDVGIFPNYSPILAEFKKMITWKKVGTKKIPEPKRGVDPEFDNMNGKINEIKQKMEDYADEVKKEIGCKEVKVVSTQGKVRFCLEIPDKVKVDEDEYILQTTLKGRKRYCTQTLEDFVEEMVDAEEML